MCVRVCVIERECVGGLWLVPLMDRWGYMCVYVYEFMYMYMSAYECVYVYTCTVCFE